MNSQEMFPIKLFLTTTQYRKMKQGKGFQLTASQIQSGVSNSAKHEVEIILDKTHYKKLLRSSASGKGFRFTQKVLQGQGLADTFKNLGNKIASGAKSVGNKIASGAKTAGKSFVKYVPKNTAKKIAKAGLNAVAKQYDLDPSLTDLASQGVDAGVDAGYATQGKGLVKFKKGSAEAKAHMAKLRAMRGGKINFKKIGSDIKRGFQKAKPVLMPIVKAVAPKLAGLAGGVAGEYVGGPAGSVIGATLAEEATRKAVGGRIRVPYGRMVRGVPQPIMTRATVDRINTQGLASKQTGTNGLVKGGSFLPLG